MNIRYCFLSSLLTMSFAGIGLAAASDAAPQAAVSGDAQAQRINDTKEYLANIDHALQLARDGGYGKLKRGDDQALQEARDNIANLLRGHTDGSQLTPEDQIAVTNDQEQIVSILRNQQKDRMVCKREAVTGSRFAITECLSVGAREERAKAARDFTETNIRRGLLGGTAQ